MELLRPLLTTYAYNILGILEEAKDVVQDAFLKFMHVGWRQHCNFYVEKSGRGGISLRYLFYESFNG
ncbi:MAG: hypothetical protein H7X88_13150 [Gloeobacteraceae cyanobacterium ES-bin-316]|nr:hypothetical protein [Ferruginibacter sp.]